MINATIIILVALIATILLFSLWFLITYLTVPIATLRTTHSYRPRGAAKSKVHLIGLTAPNIILAEELPGQLILSLLLHEDDLFFCHHGFNWREIASRLAGFALGRDPFAGGSSITQQLSKNLLNDFTQPSRFLKILRKARETVWALRLEKNFTKTEILTLYINAIRLDIEHIYGFEAATQRFFYKPAKDLNLIESFFLIGIIPQPVYVIKQLFAGRVDAFRYTRSMEKFKDLFRMQISQFGWRSIDRLGQITAKEAIERMSAFSNYEPAALSEDFEVALTIRALQEVEKLKALILTLVEKDVATKIVSPAIGVS